MCLGAQAASDAGEVLDVAGIFYVMFGWLPVALDAKDEGFGEADFVVQKRDLSRAIEQLVEAGFKQCQDPNCIELQANRRPLRDTGDGPCNLSEIAAADVLNSYHTVADAHFHLGFQYESSTVLSLYTTSELLFWLEDPESGELPANDNDIFWFSNDPRLPPYQEGGPSGPWTGLYPVRILSPVTFSEALVILMCRDYGHIDFVDHAWITMWECVVFKERPRTLSPRFQPVWDIFNAEEPNCSPYDVLRALRDDMIANNEFRYLPPVDMDRFA
ncbi:uncharacterized protein APUU_41543S [Aspergillus puulaauensis]|uniref:Uncharacterized protein n=1 Tax=Aspergillus puulaauensis TaxID=1220207 RepID=A0A7R7XPN0_9EURO|nr:uncharacterized protein APUU_41543S [Aspergillus puulaauensis]BCS25099.1 hypothetical protein APUU_41543S [Aspergillus puulaauensis]